MPEEYDYDYDYLDDEDVEYTRRSLWQLVAVLVVVVNLVLMLLMLKDCGSGSASDDTGPVSIEAVETGTPVEGMISIWVDKKSKLDLVLSSANIESANTVNMGAGKYVVEIEVGTEDAAVKSLDGMPGVRDVGRVYESSAPAKK